MLRGRDIQESDIQQHAGVAVLSRRAAELYFPKEEAIGKELGFMFQDSKDSPFFTVIGIVEDTPVENLGEKPYGIVYLPAVDPAGEEGSGVHAFSYAIRTTVPPMSIARAVRAAVAQVDPNVALGHVRSAEMIMAAATARMAFTMILLLIAGSIALLLGAVGIYGVISYVVGQRTSEIGVRMALGAQPRDVSRMVLRQSGAVVGVGLAIGLASAFGLTRLMTTLLFGVTATDATTYAAVTAFLLSVAALASWLPARRAAALDPLIALRRD
jgi:predicted lysophospholipase L1 biosynthesis ABC-type transport system permease subunit